MSFADDNNAWEVPLMCDSLGIRQPFNTAVNVNRDLACVEVDICKISLIFSEYT